VRNHVTWQKQHARYMHVCRALLRIYRALLQIKLLLCGQNDWKWQKQHARCMHVCRALLRNYRAPRRIYRSLFVGEFHQVRYDLKWYGMALVSRID